MHVESLQELMHKLHMSKNFWALWIWPCAEAEMCQSNN